MIFRDGSAMLKGAAALLLLACVAGAADPAADVDEQYAAVRAAMKKPSATGVLVTEVAPASAAAEAGIRGGDILLSYRGTRVTTLAVLRQEVADALVQSLSDAPGTGDGPHANDVTAALTRTDKVLVRLRRAGSDDPLVLPVKREPLGIRAVEVETNVAIRDNPPPSLRGACPMAWDEVIVNNVGDDANAGAVSWSRTEAIDGTPVNWQRRSLRVVGENEVEGKLETFAPDDDGRGPPSETVTFQLRGGDYLHAPAFLLLAVDVTSPDPAGGPDRTATARRQALTMKVQSPSEKFDTAAPLEEAVGAAVPLIAAAMPHAADAVLPVRLMSVRDLVGRPGYVLITRGKQVPVEPTTEPAVAPATRAGQAAAYWRVDLQNSGIIVETCWFSDDRRLVRWDVAGGTPLTARRVDSQAAATRPAMRDPHRAAPSRKTTP